MTGLAGERAKLFVWKRERDKLARPDRLPAGKIVGGENAPSVFGDAEPAVVAIPADEPVFWGPLAEKTNGRAVTGRSFDGVFHPSNISRFAP